jgi:hypothetical protein
MRKILQIMIKQLLEKKIILLTHEMESVLWWENFQSIRFLLEILLRTKTEQEYKASEK